MKIISDLLKRKLLCPIFVIIIQKHAERLRLKANFIHTNTPFSRTQTREIKINF